ncbi:hypothetical protein [Desulfovirgula thermocuniculi]|uniref:hypothetical protein n=1 Tax=Desulfovirgula thermocuniculi TaxID=348842 RepID=UPI0003F636AF|nr:hypothetical protein [Desulfovirgula thermocuniculi]
MAASSSAAIWWLRIKRAAEKIVCRPVSIHGSTDLPSHLKAAVDAAEGRVDIALNFRHIKSAEDALRAVAHELAHVVAGTSGHGADFGAAWEEIYKKLREEYFS